MDGLFISSIFLYGIKKKPSISHCVVYGHGYYDNRSDIIGLEEWIAYGPKTRTKKSCTNRNDTSTGGKYETWMGRKFRTGHFPWAKKHRSQGGSDLKSDCMSE